MNSTIDYAAVLVPDDMYLRARDNEKAIRGVKKLRSRRSSVRHRQHFISRDRYDEKLTSFLDTIEQDAITLISLVILIVNTVWLFARQ